METTSGSSSMDWGALIASLKLETVLSVLLTLVICLVAMRLIRILLQKVLQKTTLEQRIQKYVLGALRAVMWIVTVLIVADQLGIPITSLVALLSVLSLGVSLAVQTMLSNVAGGLVILSAKPFQVGDYIQTDSGEGIAKPQLPHIFEPFYSNDHIRGHTGLGLAIVKSLLHNSGGDIKVSSQIGKGTTFRLKFPYKNKK